MENEGIKERFQSVKKSLEMCRSEESRTFRAHAEAQASLAEALRNYNYWNRRVFETSGKVQMISSKRPKQKVKEKKGLLERLIALRESRKRMKDENNL